MTTDLASWLAAQLDEDQRIAEAALARVRRWPKAQPPPWEIARLIAENLPNSPLQRLEATFANPERVLAEIAAKRAMLDYITDSGEELDGPTSGNVMGRFWLQETAAVYRDRPGFDEGWTA